MLNEIIKKIKCILGKRNSDWEKIECLLKKIMQIQKELRMYKEFWDNTQDAMIFCRVIDGQILNINPAASNLYGYTKEEFCKKTIFEVSADPISTHYIANNKISSVPFRYHINSDGNKFPLSAIVTYFNDSNSETGCVAALIIRPLKLPEDVLENRRTEGV